MEWVSTDVGNVCHATHTRDPGRKPEEQFRYIDISGVDRDRKEIVSASTLFGNEAPSRARKVVQTDDVLVSTVRPNLNAVALVPEPLDGQIASTGFCVLRANQNALDARYLFYYTQHPDFVSQLMAHVRGANYPAVTDSTVKAATLPLPPPSEQRRIVEMLDQADTLRKQRAEADKLAARILPALFYQMFGDPATNPKGWDLAKLDDLGDIVTGSTPSRTHPEFFGGSTPWCKPADLNQIMVYDTNEHLTQKGSQCARMLPAGATMMCCIGSIGKIGLAMTPMATNQQINSIAFGDRITPEYGFQTLSLLAPRVEAMSGAVTVKIVKKSLFATLQMPVPPVDLQDAFSKHFVQVHKNISRSAQSSEAIHKLFDTLLHRAFSGDLTAKWRESHVKELLQEMEQQAKELRLVETKGV